MTLILVTVPEDACGAARIEVQSGRLREKEHGGEKVVQGGG